MIQRPSELARQPVHPALWILVAVMVGIELLMRAADAGLVSPVFGRFHLYTVFGFWEGAFEAALAGHAVSLPLIWSFVTYALLHGGWLHLGLNAAAFLGLGHAVSRAAGIGAALAIFVLSAAGGALLFALIADFPGPLVGASGAIFGYLAVLTAWQERMLREAGLPRTEVWQRILGLVILNAVLDLGLGGMLAWEAHLGGFLAGWLLAYVYPPRLLRHARA